MFDYVRNAMTPDPISMAVKGLQLGAQYALTGDPSLIQPSHLMSQAAQVVGVAPTPIPQPVAPQMAGYSSMNLQRVHDLSMNGMNRINQSAQRHMQDNLGGGTMGKIAGIAGGYGGRLAMEQIGMGAGYQQAFHGAVTAASYVSPEVGALVQGQLVDAAQMALASPDAEGLYTTHGMSHENFAGMVGSMASQGAFNASRLEDKAIQSLVTDKLSATEIRRRATSNTGTGRAMRDMILKNVNSEMSTQVQERASLLTTTGKEFFGDLDPQAMEQQLRQQYGDFDNVDASTIETRLDFVEKLSNTFKTSVGSILKAQRTMTEAVENVRMASGDVKLIDPVSGQAISQSSIGQGAGAQLGNMVAAGGAVMSQNMFGMSEAAGRAVMGNTLGKMAGSTLTSRLEVAGMAMESGQITRGVYDDIMAAAKSGNYDRVAQFDVALQNATGLANMNDQTALAGYVNDTTLTLKARGLDGDRISRRVGMQAAAHTGAGAGSRADLSLANRTYNRNFRENESLRRELGIGGTSAARATGGSMLDAVRGALEDDPGAYGFGEGDEEYVQLMIADIQANTEGKDADQVANYMTRNFSRAGRLAKDMSRKVRDAAITQDTDRLMASSDSLMLAKGITSRDGGGLVNLSGAQRMEIGRLRAGVKAGDSTVELDAYLQGLRGTTIAEANFDAIEKLTRADMDDLEGRIGNRETLSGTQNEIGARTIREYGATRMQLTGDYGKFMDKSGALDDVTKLRTASREYLRTSGKLGADFKFSGEQKGQTNLLAFAAGQMAMDVDWEALKAGESDLSKLVSGDVDQLRRAFNDSISDPFHRKKKGADPEDQEERADNKRELERKGATGTTTMVSIAPNTKFDIRDTTIRGIGLAVADAIGNSKNSQQ